MSVPAKESRGVTGRHESKWVADEDRAKLKRARSRKWSLFKRERDDNGRVCAPNCREMEQALTPWCHTSTEKPELTPLSRTDARVTGPRAQ